jgi:hypothetical protein
MLSTSPQPLEGLVDRDLHDPFVERAADRVEQRQVEDVLRICTSFEQTAAPRLWLYAQP